MRQHRTIPRPSLLLGFAAGLALSTALVLPTAGGLRAVDGDTVDLGYRIEIVKNRYRIAGLDAPETHGARCDSERASGKRAAAALAQALATEPITLEPIRRRDKWGRRIAALTLSGEDVARRAEREGWGRSYSGKGHRGSWCP